MALNRGHFSLDRIVLRTLRKWSRLVPGLGSRAEDVPRLKRRPAISQAGFSHWFAFDFLHAADTGRLSGSQKIAPLSHPCHRFAVRS
jgi:hypothetical protein